MELKKSLECKLCFKVFKPDQQFFLDEHIRRHLDEKHFKCPFCPKLFVTKSEVYSHLKTHPNQNYKFPEDHECQFCFVRFQWQSGLTGHLKGVLHQQEKPYWCRFCGQFFLTEAEVLEHLKAHTNVNINTIVMPICHVCKTQFENSHKFIKHFIQFHRTLLCGPFPCEVCNKSFKSVKLRKRHTNVVHQNNIKSKKYACALCNRKFHTKPDLQRHGVSHTREKPYQCQFCGKKFGLKGSLTQHERLHTKDLPFDCTICQKRFNTPDQLSNHIRIHTGERPYKCEKCAENFRTRKGFWDHRYKKHVGEITVYRCEKCRNTYSTEESLERHQNRFHK